MKTFCGLIITVLFALLGAGSYFFILKGNTHVEPGGRIVIHVTQSEKDFILQEMRDFLGSIQLISEELTQGNMKTIEKYAKKMGAETQNKIPGQLVGKLPLEFKKLGYETHALFDELSMDARDMGDANHTLGQLSEIMKKCVQCHTMYRFSTKENPDNNQPF